MLDTYHHLSASTYLSSQIQFALKESNLCSLSPKAGAHSWWVDGQGGAQRAPWSRIWCSGWKEI